MSAAQGQVTVLEQPTRQIATEAAESPRLPTVITPADMVLRAIEQNASIEILAKLMDLQQQWERHQWEREKHQAQKAFNIAMAAAQAEIKPIEKGQHVGFESRKPGAANTDYDYEDMADIDRQCKPILAAHGLFYRFRTFGEPGKPVTVTCILTHTDGHFEENSLTGPADASGNKNSIQAIGSTVTYLERYTLKPALGLSATRKDDDGRASGASGGTGAITADQIAEINAALDKIGCPPEAFLSYMQLGSIAEIPAKDFKRAMVAIGATARKRAGRTGVAK